LGAGAEDGRPAFYDEVRGKVLGVSKSWKHREMGAMKEYVEAACASDNMLATNTNRDTVQSAFVKLFCLEEMYEIFGFAKKHIGLEKSTKQAKWFLYDAVLFLTTAVKGHLHKPNELDTNWATMLDLWDQVGRGPGVLQEAVRPDSFADAAVQRKAKDSSRASKKARSMLDHPSYAATAEDVLPF
jgi:hypothetical protein